VPAPKLDARTQAVPEAEVASISKPPGETVKEEKRVSGRKKNAGFPSLPAGPRIAALTPAVKLEIVRAARRRIANETGWLPGRIKGVNAYAAMAGNGDASLVEPTDPKAKRFSLMGAVLLELHLRRVVQTAAGRLKFLEREIPGAVSEVLLGQTNKDETEGANAGRVESDPMAISHPQCLAVLDVLEERYSHRMSQARAERAKRLLKNVRLPDLVKKLEKKAQIAAEDVATALYHELTAMNRRLDKIESLVANRKPRA